MTAVSVAALTVYDMVKGVERGVTIGGVRLIFKSGGKSCEWVRHDPPGHDDPAGQAGFAAPKRQPGARAAGRISKPSRQGGRGGGKRSG